MKTLNKKEVFQTGLTEASRGVDALRSFLNKSSHLHRLNICRKKKKKR